MYSGNHYEVCVSIRILKTYTRHQEIEFGEEIEKGEGSVELVEEARKMVENERNAKKGIFGLEGIRKPEGAPLPMLPGEKEEEEEEGRDEKGIRKKGEEKKEEGFEEREGEEGECEEEREEWKKESESESEEQSDEEEEEEEEEGERMNEREIEEIDENSLLELSEEEVRREMKEIEGEGMEWGKDEKGRVIMGVSGLSRMYELFNGIDAFLLDHSHST